MRDIFLDPVQRFTAIWVTMGIVTLALIGATVAWQPGLRWELAASILICTLGGWFGGIAYLLRYQAQLKSGSS